MSKRTPQHLDAMRAINDGSQSPHAAHTQFSSHHFRDAQGNPAGGWSSGRGVSVNWQNGPLVVDGQRQPPNGAFVETLLGIAQDRLLEYQDTRFACEDNQSAITAINHAIEVLQRRSADRDKRGVEGTHRT